MLNLETVVQFFRWLLGIPEQPQAMLIPVEEDETRVQRRRPIR